MSSTKRAQKTLLFSSAGVPFLGQVSAVDSAAIPVGAWAVAENCRGTGATIMGRGGLSQFRATTGLASGTVVGAFSRYGVGDFRAIKVGSEVRLYQWNAGGSTWSDINSGNRLGNVNRVFFETFTVPSAGLTAGAYAGGLSYIVVQDGTSTPQVAAINAAGTTAMSSMTAIQPPGESKCEAYPFTLAYKNITGSSTDTFTNSTATRFALSSSTITAGRVIDLFLDSTAVAGDNAIMPFPASFSGSNAQPSQMQIVMNGIEQDVWEQVAIEVGDGSNWYLVHLPGLTKPQTVGVGDRYVAALFDCKSVGTNGTSSTISQFTAFPTNLTATRVRLTYVATTSPVQDRNISIFAWAWTHSVAFDTQFAVTFYNQSTSVESAPRVATNMPPPALKNISGTPLPGVTLAASPLAKYGYSVRYVENDASSFALIYAKQGSDFTILDRQPSACTGAGEWGGQSIYELAWGAWNLPSNLQVPLPKGGSMLMQGDRLYSAVTNASGTSSATSRVAFSEKGMPNRFVLAPVIVQGQVQPRTGGIAAFGDNTVMKLSPAPPSANGIEAVLVHTDRTLNMMSGVDAIQLARPAHLGSYGTLSPDSVVQIRNTTVWVTPEGDVKTYGGEIGDISSRLVEDVLDAVPPGRLEYITAGVKRDLLYIGYTPSGGTLNTRVLVYDARERVWTVDKPNTNTGVSFAKFSPLVSGGYARNVWVDSTGWSFEYDLPSASGDAHVSASGTSTVPTLRLLSRTLSDGMIEEVRYGDVIITADSMGAVEWTTGLVERKTGATTSGAINMNGGSELVWEYNRGAVNKNERPGAMDLGIQLEIGGAFAPGKKIYGISVEEFVSKSDGATRT